MCAAVQLGNLTGARQARLGLAIVLIGAVVVVGKGPDPEHGQPVLRPLLFAIGWLLGFALRERADEAQAAQQRADLAERERESSARVAVAEERTRIAREMHDVVAHAVSVMVLQVGAVRHRLDARDADNVQALENVERAGARTDRDASHARRHARRRRR
jgi:signal transduction histidine kinase